MSVTPRKPPTALRVGVSAEGARVPVSAARVADAVRHVLRAEKVRDAML